jgi:hypothetical protein
MYFQTGQVIFVPEWPKWEFVSILASFCVWIKSLKCKDAVNRDSTIQSLQVRRNSSSLSAIRTIEPSRPDAHLSTVLSVRTTCHPVRTKCSFRPDPILYREVFLPACICLSLALIPQGPDAREPYKEITCSGRATVRTMCHPVRTMSSNRKDFSAEISENLFAQLSVRTAHVHRPDGAQVYFV